MNSPKEKENTDLIKTNKKQSNLKFSLFLILFIVPVVALGVGIGVRWNLDSTLRSTLLQQYPDKAAEIASVSTDSICAQSDLRSQLSDVCDLNDQMSLMELGAIIAAVIGLALLICIKIAAKIAGRRRTLLLIFFAPGLHLTMLTLSALTILNAALAIGAIYGLSTLLGRIPIGLIIAIGFGALIGVLAMLRAQFSTIKRATTIVTGKKLSEQEHQKIWKFVSDLAKEMGAQIPTAIVAGLTPNFYVTEANVICLDGTVKGRTMYVSIPLCRILSMGEVKAVLAHELAHYKGSDTRFSQRFYPIYRGATQGLYELASGGGNSSSIALLPSIVILSYFLNTFSDAEKEISRERELAADTEAAKIGSARDLATSLVKLNIFSEAWLTIRLGMKQALDQGKQLINASTLFVQLAKNVEKDKALNAVAEEGPLHPTDTHPPLSQRLKNLNLSLKDVVEDGTNTSPVNPAIEILENVEKLEVELTEVEHLLMIKRGEAKIPTQQQK